MESEPKKTAGKSTELLVKEHAKKLFDDGLAEFRRQAMAKGQPIADTDYDATLNSIATRSVKAAAIFRSTWRRLKGGIFPSEDK